MDISKMMNKRGDKVLSVYWFIILALVAGGIFAMVYVFYGSPYDVRGIEANIMVDKVADFVSYSGRINSSLIVNGTVQEDYVKSNFLKDCHLNFDSTEWKEQQYYTEVNFYRLESPDNSILSISAGNSNWKAQCALQEDKTQKNLPQCVTKSFYSLDNKNNKYIIKILTAVVKSEKNVKI
jgi:hypothetical protein